MIQHLLAETIFLEWPAHIHIHGFKVVVVVIVSVIVVVIVVVVVDVVVDVHDGVDGDEYEGEECKSIEAGLRRTFSTCRSAFPGKTTGGCGGKVLWRKRGAGCQKQRLQLEEWGLDWGPSHGCVVGPAPVSTVSTVDSQVQGKVNGDLRKHCTDKHDNRYYKSGNA